MKVKKNKRRWNRDILQPPEKGILYLKDKKEGSSNTLLVNVHNMSEAGVLLESPQKFKIRSVLDMRLWHSRKKFWLSTKGKIKWIKKYSINPNHYLLGIEFSDNVIHEVVSVPSSTLEKQGIHIHDLEFLLRSNLFNTLPLEAIIPLLKNMKIKHCKAGERFIKQGEEGTHFYFGRLMQCNFRKK